MKAFWNNVGLAVFVLFISAITMYFGNLTLEKATSGEWGLMAVGIFSTFLFFGFLIVIVRELKKSRDKDNK
jgi:hypothetical protein